jgi:hypothetical protein
MLRFHVCPTLLCLKKIVSVQPMLWNSNGRFLQQAERLHGREACGHCRMESLPFDGDKRLSASKYLDFLDQEPKKRCIQEIGKRVVPRINHDLRSRSLNWVRDFRRDGSHRLPSKIFPQAGLTEDFAQLSAQHTIFQASNKAVAQAPRVDRTKPRVIC